MKTLRSRLTPLVAVPMLSIAAACSTSAEAALPAVTVYKTPTCGCCSAWVDHMRENGFEVRTIDRTDLTPVKREHDVPDALVSCHTAVIDGYAVEGHVPADVVRKLLQERPEIAGIAVPGMPMGSPGMEGPYAQPYEVYTFDASGPQEIFAVR